MRVLVACEYSGRVRDACNEIDGVEAISCDLVPSLSDKGPHIVGDVRDVLFEDWDMIVAFPPCTYLSNIQLPCLMLKCVHKTHDRRWVEERLKKCEEAALLNNLILDQHPRVPKVAVENPQPHPYATKLLGRWDATCHPWWFGDPFSKLTCWWLRGVLPLRKTSVVEREFSWVGYWRGDKQAPIADRSLLSIGMAEAIAQQWVPAEPVIQGRLF